MLQLNNIPVYVVHVRKNNELRRDYIKSHLSQFGINNPVYMLEGDMSDLSPELLEQYFKDDFKKVSPEASCTIKHLYIAEEIAKGKEEMALVFEDDIALAKNFPVLINKCLQEISNREEIYSTPFMVSYENNNKFVPRSEQKEGVMLYPRKEGRFAGAYILSKSAAKVMTEHTTENKCHLVSDWYHKYLAEQGLINIHWTHPTFAEQGSHNGKIKSLIDDKKTGFIRRIVWKIQSFIKKRFTRNLR